MMIRDIVSGLHLNRRRVPGATLVAALLLASCDANSTPAGPGARSDDAQPTRDWIPQTRGPERISERLAKAVPTFGGAFVNPDGTLSVYLTHPAASVAMRAALTAEFRRLDRPAMPVRIIHGAYAFVDLDRWIARLTPALAGPALLSTEIDERTNRIRIGIASESARSTIQQALTRAGVPTAAVVVEIAPRPQLFSPTLRSRISPLTAGSQITFWTAYNDRSECTYGPNVVWQGARHMLVNSHCTPPQGGPTVGTSIFQPKIPTYERNRGKYQVGEEIQDTEWRTNLYGCVSGYVCRYSDAALIAFRYGDRDWDLGGVMRTRNPAALPAIYGTLEVNPTAWSFEMSGIASDLFVGDVVNKVGRTTGWTVGTLESTCRNIFLPAEGRGYLCSGVVKAGAGRGDSGSPVFWTTSGGQHRLAGMLFGGVINSGDGVAGDTYYFSNWYYIDYELGIVGYPDLQAIETHPVQPGAGSRYAEDADAADTPPSDECDPTTGVACPL
jgi:hypothetical protein